MGIYNNYNLCKVNTSATFAFICYDFISFWFLSILLYVFIVPFLIVLHIWLFCIKERKWNES